METDINASRTRCSIWTRVMGYHRPISHYNIGKRSEVFSRVYFDEKVSLLSAANSEFRKEFAPNATV